MSNKRIEELIDGLQEAHNQLWEFGFDTYADWIEEAIERFKHPEKWAQIDAGTWEPEPPKRTSLPDTSSSGA